MRHDRMMGHPANRACSWDVNRRSAGDRFNNRMTCPYGNLLHLIEAVPI
jgi:hypothetical protein